MREAARAEHLLATGTVGLNDGLDDVADGEIVAMLLGDDAGPEEAGVYVMTAQLGRFFRFVAGSAVRPAREVFL